MVTLFFVRLFMGPFGKILTYLGIGLLSVGVLYGAYKMWENSVKTRALLEFNNAQLEQVIKDQQRFNAQMELLREFQIELLNQTNEQNQLLEDKLNDIDQYLGSDEATSGNRPSSDVLKETIRRLSR